MPQIVLTNVTLIDGTGAAPVPDAAIVLDGDRIAWVGQAALVQHGPDATVLDGTGCTV